MHTRDTATFWISKVTGMQKEKDNSTNTYDSYDVVRFYDIRPTLNFNFVPKSWVGVLILHGALGGRLKYWRRIPYGLGYTPI